MNKNLDLRGLVCPEPVLRTKKLLDDKSVEKVEALVESEVNVNNLTRLAQSLKLKISSTNEADYYKVVIEREREFEGESTQTTAAAQQEHMQQHTQKISSTGQTNNSVGTVLFLSKETFGDGDKDFSISLMNVFLQTMLDSGHRPRAILLANSGVRLMAPDAATLKVLNDFKAANVEVLACGLCVEYYGLKGKIATEQITNMFAICEFLMAADKVVVP